MCITGLLRSMEFHPQNSQCPFLPTIAPPQFGNIPHNPQTSSAFLLRLVRNVLADAAENSQVALKPDCQFNTLGCNTNWSKFTALKTLTFHRNLHVDFARDPGSPLPAARDRAWAHGGGSSYGVHCKRILFPIWVLAPISLTQQSGSQNRFESN